MVEIFREFTSTLVIVAVLLALGIIFEKQLIALEDRFDKWVREKRSQRKECNNGNNIRTRSNIQD